MLAGCPLIMVCDRCNNKLSYRRGTARRAMLVNSRYVSRAMGLERFQTAKVAFKVIQGHLQWCHSIGHIRFPISLPMHVAITGRDTTGPPRAAPWWVMLHMRCVTVNDDSHQRPLLVGPPTLCVGGPVIIIIIMMSVVSPFSRWPPLRHLV